MRPITGTDITDFYNTRYDLLVLTADGEFNHIDYTDVTSSYDDGRATAYDYVTTDDGEVQILLERSAITDRDWFPDALDDNGTLIPSVADEMTDLINQDGILAGRVEKTIQTTKDWETASETANQLALKRAAHVAEIVAYCGGNQSKAARVLGLDQSTVNKLVAKHRRA